MPPQRGHSDEEQPAQVVPQLQQVLHTCWQPRLFTQPQFALAVVAVLVAVVPVAVPFEQLQICWKEALCCGNSGREKNSSHTFSANSSHGGISQ